jgi:hypothetical protein
MKVNLLILLLLVLVLFTKYHLTKTNLNNHFSINLLEEYLNDETNNVSVFKPNLLKVNKQIKQLKAEHVSINYSLKIINPVVIILFIIQMLVLLHFVLHFKIRKLDGLLVFLFTVLLACSIFIVFKGLDHFYLEGSRANNSLIKQIYYSLSMLFPIFCFSGFFLNQQEIKLGYHQYNWISTLLLSIGIIFGVIILISGFGLFLVPDLSNFKN